MKKTHLYVTRKNFYEYFREQRVEICNPDLAAKHGKKTPQNVFKLYNNQRIDYREECVESKNANRFAVGLNLTDIQSIKVTFRFFQ